MIDRQLNYGRHLVGRFLFESLPYHSVLDIGAGAGTDLKLAKKANSSAKLSAVEVYTPYADLLRSKGIQVHALNIERDRLPFTDSELDVVIANQVLEHTKELFWIFHEVTRVLRIGGRFIIGVPNLAALHNRLLLLLGEQPSPIKSHSAHVRGFTRSDLINFMEASFPGGGTNSRDLVEAIFILFRQFWRDLSRGSCQTWRGAFSFCLRKSAHTVASFWIFLGENNWKPIFGWGQSEGCDSP